MDKLQTLLDELRAAQGWCDHHGDTGTGIVSLSVDTLQQWENEVIDIINELEEDRAYPELDVQSTDA